MSCNISVPLCCHPFLRFIILKCPDFFRLHSLRVEMCFIRIDSRPTARMLHHWYLCEVCVAAVDVALCSWYIVGSCVWPLKNVRDIYCIDVSWLYSEAAQRLCASISREDAREDMSNPCTDNSISSLGKLILHQSSVIDPLSLIPFWYWKVTWK